MADSIRFKMTRKNLVIDGGLNRAIEGLYALYYLYLVEHPDLADYLEDLMHRINDCRSDLKRFQALCWETTPPQFDSIADLDAHLIQARKDTSNGGKRCRGYFNALEDLRQVSSQE